MSCRADGMSRNWKVAQRGCRADGMSRSWKVAQLGFRANGMSRRWDIAQLKCRASEKSRKCDVAQLECHADEISRKKMSRKWCEPDRDHETNSFNNNFCLAIIETSFFLVYAILRTLLFRRAPFCIKHKILLRFSVFTLTTWLDPWNVRVLCRFIKADLGLFVRIIDLFQFFLQSPKFLKLPLKRG